MRAPVFPESWWKRTVLGEVALYSLTGTLTSPKLIAPDQIARAIQALYSERAVRSRRERSLAGPSGRYISRNAAPRRFIRCGPPSLPGADRRARCRRAPVSRSDGWEDRRRR